MRGLRSGLLTAADYSNITQCESLDDIKLYLVRVATLVQHHTLCGAQAATDYGSYLSNEASPLHTTTLVERCTQKLVDDWNYLRNNVWLAFQVPVHTHFVCRRLKIWHGFWTTARMAT